MPKSKAEETMSILRHLRKEIPEAEKPKREPELEFEDEDEEELPLTKPKAAQKIF